MTILPPTEFDLKDWPTHALIARIVADDWLLPARFAELDATQRAIVSSGDYGWARRILVDPVCDAWELRHPDDKISESDRCAWGNALAIYRPEDWTPGESIGFGLTNLRGAHSQWSRFHDNDRPDIEALLTLCVLRRLLLSKDNEAGSQYVATQVELFRRGAHPIAFGLQPPNPDKLLTPNARFLVNAIAIAGGAPVSTPAGLAAALAIEPAALRDAVSVAASEALRVEPQGDGRNRYLVTKQDAVLDVFGRFLAVPDDPAAAATNTGVRGEEAIIAFGIIGAVAEEILDNLDLDNAPNTPMAAIALAPDAAKSKLMSRYLNFRYAQRAAQNA